MHWPVQRILMGLVAVAVMGVMVYAFLPQPVLVELAPVSRGDLQVTVDEDGKTRVKERYTVRSPLSGRLRRIEWRAGDPLTQQESVLAVIDPADPQLLDARVRAQAEARVRAAEAQRHQASALFEKALANLQFAETDLGRIRQLHAKRAASDDDVEQADTRKRAATEDYRAARFAEEIAKFEIELAQAALLRTDPESDTQLDAWQVRIRSPVSGQVLRVIREDAGQVEADTPLLEVGNSADLELEIDVLSMDAVRIRPGAEVRIENWGGSGPLQGQVRVIEPSAFTKISALGVEEQRVNIIADLTDAREKWENLGDNYRIDARILVSERKNVLKVPSGALFRHQSGWAVYRLVQRRVQLQLVEVGERNSREAEILSGLSEGDSVVVYPSDKVRPGVAIRQG